MTKSQTEQWKDGTIKEGLYFIKTKHTRCYKKETDMLYPDGCRSAFSNYPIVEVLAPVPSYDEYKRLQEQLNEANKVIKSTPTLDVFFHFFEMRDYTIKVKKYLEKWGVK